MVVTQPCTLWTLNEAVASTDRAVGVEERELTTIAANLIMLPAQPALKN
jgi:hypothetical protein